MEMKRLSKFSKIKILDIKEINELEKVIQINKVEDYSLYIVEFIPNEFIESYLLENTKGSTTTDKEAPFDTFPKKTQEEMELETALDTVLNNDPLGRYNGCNLRVPFDKGDAQWVEWVLANMHNKFIKDKVKLIKESGYGAK